MKRNTKKVKRLERSLNGLITAMDIAVFELDQANTLLDKYVDNNIPVNDEDEEWLDLMGAESFTIHCANVRNVLISIMYCINKPKLMQEIQQKILIESMKEEINKGDVPQDVIDNFLDFMNITKSY